jgi:glycosyltransferase involved in cell wall biosynthesis
MVLSNDKNVLHVVLNTGVTNMGFNEFYLRTSSTSSCLSYMASSDSEFTAAGNIIYFFSKARFFSKKFKIIHFHSHVLAFFYTVGLLFTYPKGLSRCVYTVHTSKNNLSFKNYVFFLASMVLCKRTVCCSRSSYLSFSFILRWLFKYKFLYITNGIYLEKSSLEFNFHAKLKIISVGRLIPLKAPGVIISALKSLRSNFSCIFLGQGELDDELRNKVNDDDRFEFLGLVNRSKVNDLLSQSDVFISSSLVEGMPIAALEAAAGGCYLLLSNIPPHIEIAKELPFCNIFNSKDELSGFLENLLKQDSEFFRNVFFKNSEAVLENFSLKEMLEKYMEVYKVVID